VKKGFNEEQSVGRFLETGGARVAEDGQHGAGVEFTVLLIGLVGQELSEHNQR